MDAVETNSWASWVACLLARVLGHVRAFTRAMRARRRSALQVCATLSLGERRSLVVVEYEQRRFLIGATSQRISLLERLDSVKAAEPDGDWASESAPGKGSD
jgi:flagellar biogenesis protein FliO